MDLEDGEGDEDEEDEEEECQVPSRDQSKATSLMPPTGFQVNQRRCATVTSRLRNRNTIKSDLVLSFSSDVSDNETTVAVRSALKNRYGRGIKYGKR